MALSDREQRLLEEMERHLYQSEADVVDTSKSTSGRPNYRSIVIGVALAVAGVGILLAAVMLNVLIVGVLGFVAMLFGVLYTFSPKRTGAEASPRAQRSESKRQSRPPRASRSFTARMEERWEERGDGTR